MILRYLAAGLAAVSAATLLSACSSLDVNEKYSKKSFDALTAKVPSVVADKSDSYVLWADETASLIVKKDFAGSEDIVLETDLQPFLDAGLDAAKLPDGFSTEGGKLKVIGDYGSGDGAKSNIRDALFQSVSYDRTNLTYHPELDHFGIKLPKGKFEFAKDTAKNDKDIVFVIAAAPLRDIGVDVEKVNGWVFKTMQDENGKNVDLLLKPYDLA